MQISKTIKSRLNNILATDRVNNERISYPLKKDIESVLASYIDLENRPIIITETGKNGFINVKVEASGLFIK